jgi:hypothetical protein
MKRLKFKEVRHIAQGCTAVSCGSETKVHADGFQICLSYCLPIFSLSTQDPAYKGQLGPGRKTLGLPFQNLREAGLWLLHCLNPAHSKIYIFTNMICQELSNILSRFSLITFVSISHCISTYTHRHISYITFITVLSCL